MEAYRPYAHRSLPVTESVYRRILCLPLFEDLTTDQVDSICDIVERAVEANLAPSVSRVRAARVPGHKSAARPEEATYSHGR
jgi:hypothetical protein